VLGTTSDAVKHTWDSGVVSKTFTVFGTTSHAVKHTWDSGVVSKTFTVFVHHVISLEAWYKFNVVFSSLHYFVLPFGSRIISYMLLDPAIFV
jgi:hypothetical protein